MSSIYDVHAVNSGLYIIAKPKIHSVILRTVLHWLYTVNLA